MKKKLLKITLSILLISCNSKEKKISFPLITDSIPRTTTILNSNKMLEGGYALIGVAELGTPFEIKNLGKKDDAYINKYLLYLDSNENNQNLDYEELIEIPESNFEHVSPPPPLPIFKRIFVKPEHNKLKICIDTNQILNMPNYKSNLEINENIKKGSNGIIEYSNSIKNSYEKYYVPSKNLKQSYPLIVLNQSDSIIPIETKEGWLYMIQEAIDENGVWKPIEYYDPFAFCGNSFWKKNLLPNYYVVSKVYKYTGDFKTKLRVKFTTNQNIYYSNEFYGSVNIEQFSLPKIIHKTGINKRNVYFFNN